MCKQCPQEVANESSTPKPTAESWFKQAISDETGQVDMAYLVIGQLSIAAIASLAFVGIMSFISYTRCTRIVDVGKGKELVRAAVPCVFDPLPFGQAAGLIFAAFAALIGAFAGYMAATRRRPRTGE